MKTHRSAPRLWLDADVTVGNGAVIALEHQWPLGFLPATHTAWGRAGHFQVLVNRGIVQDDFQLICWDFVSEPSTPGAFMMKEGKEVSPQFINNVFNKTDRIDRIFNDIMEWK